MAPRLEIDVAHPDAWTRFYGAMVFPNNLDRQRQLMAAYGGNAMALIEEGMLPDPDGLMEEEIWRDILRPSGGFRTLTEADGPAIQKQVATVLQGPLQEVGGVVCVLRQIYDHHDRKAASMAGAWGVLRESGGFPISIKRYSAIKAFIERSWVPWNCVAHLFAAYVIGANCCAARIRDGQAVKFHSEEVLSDVLAWAQDFRSWGTGFTPFRSSQGPILKKAEAVELVTDIPPRRPPLLPLRPERLAKVQGYGRRS